MLANIPFIIWRCDGFKFAIVLSVNCLAKVIWRKSVDVSRMLLAKMSYKTPKVGIRFRTIILTTWNQVRERFKWFLKSLTESISISLRHTQQFNIFQIRRVSIKFSAEIIVSIFTIPWSCLLCLPHPFLKRKDFVLFTISLSSFLSPTKTETNFCFTILISFFTPFIHYRWHSRLSDDGVGAQLAVLIIALNSLVVGMASEIFEPPTRMRNRSY